MTDLDLAEGMPYLMRWRGRGIQGTGMVKMREEIPTEVLEITEVTMHTPIQSQGAKEITQGHEETVVNAV